MNQADSLVRTTIAQRRGLRLITFAAWRTNFFVGVLSFAVFFGADGLMRSFIVFCMMILACMAGPANASDGFAGSWKIDADIVKTMTLDSTGNGSMLWQPRARQGDGGPISGCVPSGRDVVSCGWSATYFDHDKTIVRHGTMTMDVDGDTLEITQCKMTIDSEDWHVDTYPSSAEFCGPSHWKRADR